MGTANSSKITAVARGYPGNPITGAIPARWAAYSVGRLIAARLRPLRVAEQRRVTRPHRDAGHGDAADLGEHGGGVIAAPPA